MRYLLSEIWFKISTSYCPREMPILVELDNPYEEKRVALNSSLQIASLDSVEWVS